MIGVLYLFEWNIIYNERRRSLYGIPTLFVSFIGNSDFFRKQKKTRV